MTLKTTRRFATLLQHIREQERWIEEHGGSEAGYLARYGEAGDGGAAIYAADRAALDDLLAKARAELDEAARLERRRAAAEERNR